MPTLDSPTTDFDTASGRLLVAFVRKHNMHLCYVASCFRPTCCFCPPRLLSASCPAVAILLNLVQIPMVNREGVRFGFSKLEAQSVSETSYYHLTSRRNRATLPRLSCSRLTLVLVGLIQWLDLDCLRINNNTEV